MSNLIAPNSSIPEVESRLDSINQRLTSFSDTVATRLSLLLLLGLIAAISIVGALLLIALQIAPTTYHPDSQTILCQPAQVDVPILKSITFNGSKPFASGCHRYLSDKCRQNTVSDREYSTDFLEQFKNEDGKTPTVWLDNSSNRRIMNWTVFAGHDVDELGPKVKRHYISNLGLATQRTTFLRRTLERALSHRREAAVPVLTSVLSNYNWDKKQEEDKDRDRTPELVVSYYEPASYSTGEPALNCKKVTNESLTTALYTPTVAQ